jgi:DNA-binding MarR family transcriptional regulator
MPQTAASVANDGHRTLYLIRQVQYGAYVRLEKALLPLGVTAVQFRILTTLSTQDKISSAELGRIYKVKPQTMIKQIVALEEKKLISRSVAATNKRVLEVALTERGRETLAACAAVGKALEEELLKPFSDGEQVLYRELLQKLLSGLDDLDEEVPPAVEPNLWTLPVEGAQPGVQRPPPGTMGDKKP